jgi:lambda family phage tail tape measure protein
MSTKYLTKMSEKHQALLLGRGQSERVSQREDVYARLRQDWQEQGGKPSDQGYLQQLRALQNYYAQEDALRSDWLKGAQKGWHDYLDSATGVYDAMTNVAGNALSGLSDTLTTLLSTGKASFRDFTRSVLKMITDIINKLMVANAVKSMLNSASAGGSWASILNTLGNNLFAGGGYTGDGGKHEPKGIVHGGEFVFTKQATERIGVSQLYALMHRAQGDANGGYVGNAPMHGLVAGSGNITVDLSGMQIITQRQSEQMSDKNSNELVSKAVRQEVITLVFQQLDKALGQSGRIANFVTSKIGR